MDVTLLQVQAPELPIVEWGPVLLIIVGTIGLGLLLIAQVRRRIARRDAGIPNPREFLEQIKTNASDTEELHRLNADLVANAQRLASQLDNKAERLEQVIQRAESLIVRAEGRIGILGSELEEMRVRDRRPRDDRDIHAALRQTESRAEPRSAGPDDVVSSPDQPSPDPLTQSILSMAGQGQTPVEIARELDEQVGKVELIIALHSSMKIA